MRLRPAFAAFITLGLAAQTPSQPGTALPALTWRGALWASGAWSSRDTADGGMFLRSQDAPNGSLSLDGLQIGADTTFADGWGARFTLLAGQAGKILNAATLDSGGKPVEGGSIAWPEAMLIWTGKADTFKAGRMLTPTGMEVLDQTQDLTASRGILATFAGPFAQVGLAWHHTFTPSWSADAWVFNGEDRLQDNNRGKTWGLGVTYNQGGAANKSASVMVFSGPEQDGLGAYANTGAEGRRRERIAAVGQWAWGRSTLLWEADLAREKVLGPERDPKEAGWGGAGLIYRFQATQAWALIARAEYLKDAAGIRLTADPTSARAVDGLRWPDLEATSGALGVERRWHATFTRAEVRVDHLSRDVREGSAGDGKAFSGAMSLTWSLGTSF